MSNISLILLVIAGSVILGLGIGLIFAESVTPGFGLIVGLGVGLLLSALIIAFRKK
ncbi:MAG: hypothetical protein IBX64_08340 [Actinobacteria bacterium]|nr:hypothetical protein [Actinomycetota bacterium]